MQPVSIMRINHQHARSLPFVIIHIRCAEPKTIFDRCQNSLREQFRCNIRWSSTQPEPIRILLYIRGTQVDSASAAKGAGASGVVFHGGTNGDNGLNLWSGWCTPYIKS